MISSFKAWLKGLLRGGDGNTSISNFVMFAGLGGTYPIAVALLLLTVTGAIEWPEKPMEWLLKYNVTVTLPYIFKMFTYIFSSKSGVSIKDATFEEGSVDATVTPPLGD